MEAKLHGSWLWRRPTTGRMVRLWCTLVLVLATTVSFGAKAPAPGVSADEFSAMRAPVLVADDGERGKPLALTRLAAEAHVVGGLAETRLTMTFTNDLPRAVADRW